jgi:hypothetical protein
MQKIRNMILEKVPNPKRLLLSTKIYDIDIFLKI